jgi:hypothetical protein
MNTDQLNAAHGIAGHLRFVTGQGGFTLREGSSRAWLRPQPRLARPRHHPAGGSHRLGAAMLCVETSNAGSDSVTIVPGENYRLVARYSLEHE